MRQEGRGVSYTSPLDFTMALLIFLESRLLLLSVVHVVITVIHIGGLGVVLRVGRGRRTRLGRRMTMVFVTFSVLLGGAAVVSSHAC